MVKRKVLIVDDDQEILLGLNVRLRASGYETAFASDAIAAMSVAQRETPDAVVLDIGLPGGDGFVVMQRFRSVASLAHIPVIVLSGRDSELNRTRALDMGAKAFFQKPVENDELLKALESVCSTQKVESKNAKILIVDDDQDTLMAISLRLRMNGYDTALATDGISAITVAQREHPDLVLLDLGLPGGDGFVVLERLRMFASLAAVPVVVLSGQDPHENRNRAMEAGLSTYLQKPVDNEEMLAAIERCLSRPPMFAPTAMPPESSRPAS